MTHQLRAHSVDRAAEWLLSDAVCDAEEALLEWEQDGLTLLWCGARFSAVRVPLWVAEASAGTTDPAAVDLYLAAALLGAPVIRCQHGQWLYILCEPSTVKGWRVPSTECLGDGHQLGVPRPDVVSSSGRAASYWAVPISEPGHLGNGTAVSQLVSDGHFRKVGVISLDRARQVWDEVLLLTRDLPGTVPRREQLELLAAELRPFVEQLVSEVDDVIAEETDSADRQTAQWLLDRVRKSLGAEGASTDREAAMQAEVLALSCRALAGFYERQRVHRRGGEPRG
ncbi:DUF6415 family natural product biosynthesis protein [Streptomyces sp. NPDC002514]|uniref:DUF6415 family natural product biosynthesis protein n=1 Tax=Streptomyces sp. NPDC001270 TaxID=3364554 RepID=UPI0036B80037